MNNILYILGAGFSAPFGVPLMNNFIEKAKDLYFKDTIKYSKFINIFDIIKKMAYLKNFIDSDLMNIEEILSILEMGYYVKENKKELYQYKDFIKEVINSYTPLIPSEYKFIEHNIDNFKIPGNYDKYFYFVMSLFDIKCKLNVENTRQNGLHELSIVISFNNNDRKYNIITLNYDLIIENCITILNNRIQNQNKLIVQNNINNIQEHNLSLAKLHGSIDDQIILPTWNKTGAQSNLKKQKNIKKSWELAYNLIKNANEIRILGYSLPQSDNYIKYLFSVGLKDSEHLKKIDIITLDYNEETMKRYQNLFKFKNLRFKSFDLKTYLEKIHRGRYFHNAEIMFDSSFIEETHNEVMES